MTRPHVLMLLASAVDFDTRVKKEAISLSNSGCLVTLVARGTDPEQSVSNMHGVRVVRQPVDLALHRTALTTDEMRARSSQRWRRGLNDRQALSYANSMTALKRREVESLKGKQTKFGVDAAYKRKAARTQSRLNTLVLRIARRLRWPYALMSGAWPRVRLIERQTRRWEERLGELIGSQMTATEPMRGNWESVLPYLVDTEIAFGQFFDRFPPTIIHCHDFFTLPMAVHARERAYANGQNPLIVYDSHELVTGLGGHYSTEIFKAYVEIEEQYIDEVDAIVTVTQELADRLAKIYRPPRAPTVVHNAPPLSANSVGAQKSVRQLLGLDSTTPLGVYIGSINPKRGIDDLITAMPELPDFHVAVAATRMHSSLETALNDLADESGVADRVHFVDPVDPDEVVSYIGDADIGLILSRNDVINHHVALSNKLFEYLHAGLPVITSNCEALEKFVTATGVGGVFSSGDAESLASVIRKVLDNIDVHSANITDELLRQNSWETSQTNLIGLYAELLRIDLDREPPHPVRIQESEWHQ